MKQIFAASLAAASLALAGHAFAQDQAPAQTGALTLDTPIEDIVANPDGKKVIDADLRNPNNGKTLTDSPMYEQFKSMSLRQLQPMSQGRLTDDMLKQVEADLAKIQPSAGAAAATPAKP